MSDDPWSSAAEETKSTAKKSKVEKKVIKAKVVKEKAPTSSLQAPTTSKMAELATDDIANIDPTDFNALLSAMGFEKLSDTLHRMKLNIGIHGMEKSGKSQFCMSAAAFEGLDMKVNGAEIKIPPGWPVIIIDTEEGTRQLAPKIPKKYQDRIFRKQVYRENSDTFECDPLASLIEVDKILSMVHRMPQGTVVIDSFPDVVGWMNGVLRLKVLNINPNERVQPSDYFWRNDKMRGMIMKLFGSPSLHVIITAQDEEEYNDARLTPTGVYKANWYKKVPYWVDFVLAMRKAQSREGISRWIDVEATRFELPPGMPPVTRIMPAIFPSFVEAFAPAFAVQEKDKVDWGQKKK